MVPKSRQIGCGCGCDSSQTKKYQFSARQKSGHFFLSTIKNTIKNQRYINNRTAKENIYHIYRFFVSFFLPKILVCVFVSVKLLLSKLWNANKFICLSQLTGRSPNLGFLMLCTILLIIFDLLRVSYTRIKHFRKNFNWELFCYRPISWY